MRNQFILFLLCLFCIPTLQSQQTLTVAPVLSDGMVVQRNQAISLWGTGTPNDTVFFKIKSHHKTIQVNPDGTWKTTLPKQKIGLPFSIKIHTKKDRITIRDILAGEVWLASGQSNMHLDLKRTIDGEAIAKKANNKNIRIFNMKPTYPTGENGVHTLAELTKIQNDHYFNTKGWVKASPENVRYFSAVAYYFAEKLQKELNIPIGIIHNAVPGSPIESWISKKTITQDPAIQYFTKQRWLNKNNEDGMISTAKNQISLSHTTKQKHPWMPTYNYVNGILPIKNMVIKGVIWYQGESNAAHPELYKNMLQKMVALWRTDFNQDFPFYSVQLTSRENRSTWPAFRNAQRELRDLVPNSKMVVITDVGDKNDTHAKNKKPVGDRLAILALGDTYQLIDDYESPLFDKTSATKNGFQIHFKGSFNQLKTKGEKEIIGFEFSYDNLNFAKLQTEIQGKSIFFKNPIPKKKPIYIRYAWKAYTEANVISTNNLPVSPFQTKIN
ncbi:sialate O-acetylesterase [Flavicella sediminum]|uniref:sialate O-acetylesterase n=1 Tax=Flavicella sediminum TaxID=2585141 RepID=UPI0011212088|nr:sialate O-acetylesterase [Flavicella sediminum]